MTTLPARIEVVFTADDVQNAESYISCTDCLLATALKRMGYSRPGVGSCGECHLNTYTEHDVKYFPEEKWFPGGFVTIGRAYNPAVIGRTLTLVRQDAPTVAADEYLNFRWQNQHNRKHQYELVSANTAKHRRRKSRRRPSRQTCCSHRTGEGAWQGWRNLRQPQN